MVSSSSGGICVVIDASRYDFQRYLSGALVQWSSLAREGLVEPVREDFLGSLLLTDISGFTRLTSRLSESGRGEGAERVSQILNHFMSNLVSHIEEHGGTVLSVGGDSLLAGWRAQAPRDMKIAVWRSCHCASGIRGRVRGPAFAEEFLGVRSAIGAGSIALLHVLPRQDQRWMVISGNCVEQVNRCGQLADVDEILVSPEAWDLIKERSRGQSGPQGTTRFESIEPFPTENPVSPAVGKEVSMDLGIYLPLALRGRLLSPLSQWLADRRTVAAMFAQIIRPGLDTDLYALDGLVRSAISAVAHEGGEVLHIAMNGGGLEILAAFGLPSEKHSDYALSAIISAAHLSDELAKQGVEFSAGIATGESFCGALGAPHRADYTVVGDAVNTAARFASVAAGRILVDRSTVDRTRSQITFKGPWLLSIPGVRGGIAAYVPAAASEAIETAEPLDLIDREADLKILDNYVEVSPKHGRGVLVLKGDPGLGKSALIRAFMERARNRGFHILFGGADDIERHTPYFAWRGILREILGLRDVRGEESSEIVNRFFKNKPDLLPVAPLLNDAIDLTLPDTVETQAMSGDGRLRNLQKLLRDLVADACGQRCCIILEDVHWLDEASGLLLGRLISDPHPFHIIVSTRTAEVEGELERWAGRREIGLTRLNLMPFDFANTVTLIRTSLGAGLASDGFDEMVYAQSGGNPFLVSEICKMIGQRGELSKESSAEALSPVRHMSETALLDTAKVTVRSRTDSLPADGQVVLKFASALGSTFSAEDLAALHPIKSTKVNIEQCLVHLQSANLVKPADHWPDRFVFSHAIIRRAVYDSMLADQRREAHSAIATALEESGQPDNSENLPLILSHWERAGDLIRAHNYLDRVAELRLRQFDNAAVIDLIVRFLRNADEGVSEIDPQRRVAACFLLGEASLNVGRAQIARNAYEEGLRLSGHPLPVSRASVAFHLLLDLAEQVWRRLTHRDPDWILSRDLIQSQSEPFQLAAKAHEDLTRIYYFTSEKLRLVHATLRATNLAERNKFVTPTTAANYASLGAICGVIPIRSQAEHYSRLAAALADRIDHMGTRVRVHLLAGLYQTSIGRWTEAKNHFDAGIECAATVGDMRRWSELAVGLETITGPWLLTPVFGGVTNWQKLVERICEEGRARGDAQVLGCGLLGGARGYAALGFSDSMDLMIEDFSKLIAENNSGLELVHFVEGASFLADAAFKRGDKSEARSWLENAFKSLTELNPAMKTRTLPALLRLFSVSSDHDPGNVARAKFVLRKLRRFARVYPVGRPALALCESRLRARLGQPRRARNAAQRAFGLSIQMGMPADAVAAMEYLACGPDSPRRHEFERMVANNSPWWREVLPPDPGMVYSSVSGARIGDIR